MTLMNASIYSTLGICFSFLFTMIYWFFVLPVGKAKKAALTSVILGSTAMVLVFYNFLNMLAPFGGLLVLAAWILPSIYLFSQRNSFRFLNQRDLIGLQIFRFIGGFFILEMFRGHIPGVFAWPAGIGDILVALIATFLLLSYRDIPRWGVILVLVAGLADFTVAFFFGVTSQPGPLQLFSKDFNNQLGLFPTGLIPIFLVPYAIVFHTLSWINLKDDS